MVACGAVPPELRNLTEATVCMTVHFDLQYLLYLPIK